MKSTKPIIAAIAFTLASSFITLTADAKRLPINFPLNATEDVALGLYDANNLVLSKGGCDGCTISPQALWYFERELIAVPNTAKPKQALSTVALTQAKTNHVMPPLVWLGSPLVIPQTKISENATAIGELGNLEDGGSLFLVDKIPTNLSYWDNSTFAFFKQRPIRLRGEMTDRGFVARTIWPLDYKMPKIAEVKPLQANETLKSLVQFEHGGAKSAYETRLLWAKNDEAKQLTAGKSVIGFMLNGAQGDDDEAHGGHFAVVTGRMEADGNYARWLVNNYYNLASNSEKGIIAGITPMDNYLADLNSGQSYYRPSYMLVAVLKSDVIPNQFQTATNESFDHFYRNDFLYDHSRENCAGISIDTLRKLGWNIPTRGVESQLKAIAAYFYVAATEKSLTKGRAIYDYLNTETTRLFPAVAFDAIGENMLLGANQWSRKLYVDHNPVTPFMEKFGQDVEAIYFVRIPQIPSSRAFGQAPVYSFDQYTHQAPADRSTWKIVPTTPRVLPKSLQSEAVIAQQAANKPSLIPWPVAVVGLSLIVLFSWAIRKIARRQSSKQKV